MKLPAGPCVLRVISFGSRLNIRRLWRVPRTLMIVIYHRGRSVSTGWLRWWWHAEEAWLASLNIRAKDNC